MAIRTLARRSSSAVLGLSLAGLLAMGAAPAAGTHAAAKSFLSYNAKTNTATLSLVAGYDNTKAGFNFNGGADGSITITVPVNAKVVTTFVNMSSIPHSADYIADYKTAPAMAPAPAFKGAASPDYTKGAEKGDKPATFTFTANKVGKYRVICAVPGHLAAGMWDWLIVSSSAKTATYVKK